MIALIKMKFSVRFSIIRIVLTFAVAALLVACATPGKIKRIDRSKTCHCDPKNATLGKLLEKALADPESHESTHALAYFVEQWHQEKSGVNEGDVEVQASDGQMRRYRVNFESAYSRDPLGYFEEISPAYDFKVKKLKHHQRDGVGAPLLAIRENKGRELIESFFPPEAITRPITAVITGGRKVVGLQKVQIDLLSPFRQDKIRLNGRSRSLAADLSVPWAFLLAKAGKLKRAQLVDFIDSTPGRDPGLFLMEPYAPDKEPLIMIHGLLGTPLIWAELTNTLWADDEIRSRYQIWHFLYNTSAPALYSGRILRDQLREVRPLLDPSGRDPAMQSTTIIAHSMGGIITRSLLTRPGEAFWDVAFNQSFDSLKLSDKDRKSLKEAFYWDSTPHVKRVIYIAASHRGSNFADNPLGWLGRLAARPPKSGFRDFYERISEANPGAFTKAYKELGEGKLDSVHALSPRQPSLPILASLPNNHRVREFSIIGNEGKAGPLEESSDGIVDYWSSHIDRAESEKIVPAGHYAFKHSEAVAEVKRVLKLN